MYEVDGLNINSVLKIIFCRNNEEVRRTIEMPYKSLEKDMLEIVFKNNAVHVYINRID